MGGKRKNMPLSKRKKLQGRGPVGKTTVVGAKCRETKQVKAKVIQSTDRETLHDFIEDVTDEKAKVYTDEWPAYKEMNREHDSVNHGKQEYAKTIKLENGKEEKVHTNGIEGSWSMFNRAYVGTYH